VQTPFLFRVRSVDSFLFGPAATFLALIGGWAEEFVAPVAGRHPVFSSRLIYYFGIIVAASGWLTAFFH